MKKINILLIFSIIIMIFFFRIHTANRPPYKDDIENKTIEPGTYKITKEYAGIYDIENTKTGEYEENFEVYKTNEITIKDTWKIDGRKDSASPKYLSAGTYVVGDEKDLKPGNYKLKPSQEYDKYEIEIDGKSSNYKNNKYYNESNFNGHISVEKGDKIIIEVPKGGLNVFEIEENQ